MCTDYNIIIILNVAPSAVRLVSKNEQTSPYLTAGRLDTFFVGRWGTVCTNGFTSTDARALCSILTGSTSVLSYGAVGSQSTLGYKKKQNNHALMLHELCNIYDIVVL